MWDKVKWGCETDCDRWGVFKGVLRWLLGGHVWTDCDEVHWCSAKELGNTSEEREQQIDKP